MFRPILSVRVAVFVCVCVSVNGRVEKKKERMKIYIIQMWKEKVDNNSLTTFDSSELMSGVVIVLVVGDMVGVLHDNNWSKEKITKSQTAVEL